VNYYPWPLCLLSLSFIIIYALKAVAVVSMISCFQVSLGRKIAFLGCSFMAYFVI